MTDHHTFQPTTISNPNVGAYGISRAQLFFVREQGDVPFFDIKPLRDWEQGREFASSRNAEIALDLAISHAAVANQAFVNSPPKDISDVGLIAFLQGIGISAYAATAA